MLHGTKGIRLCGDVQIFGEEIFTKHQQDAFTSKELDEYLNKNAVNSVSIIGLDSSSCVFKTALGAANRGYNVTVMQDGVLGKRVSATKSALSKLSQRSISVC